MEKRPPHLEVIVASMGIRADRVEMSVVNFYLTNCVRIQWMEKNPLLRSECCISRNQSREIREEHHKLLSHKRWLFMRVRVCVHVWGCVRVRACMHVCVYVII